ELGWSKIYSELDITRHDDDAFEVAASWQGFKFLTLKLSQRRANAQPPLSTNPCFHHKVIPATQQWGREDVSYVTMTPAGGSSVTLVSNDTADQAEAAFIRPTWEDMPTQSHIVNRLADIKLGKLLSAGVFESRGGKDLSDQVRFV